MAVAQISPLTNITLEAQQKLSYTIHDEISSFLKENHLETLKQAKKRNIAIARSLFRVAPEEQKLSYRVYHCADQVNYTHSESLHKTHIEGYFCDFRCCPVCAWYKSRSLFSRVYRYCRENSDKSFVFVTLTVPNVTASDLRSTVLLMNKAFGRMFALTNKQCFISNLFDGYIRRVEVTYNFDNNTFHPHIHALFQCKSEYAPNTECFLHKQKLLELWRKYTGIDTITQVNIKQVKPKNIDSEPYDKALAGACAEVAKYPIKMQDKLFWFQNWEKLDSFISAIMTLKGVRFEASSKDFKHILHFVQSKDDHSVEPSIESAADTQSITLRWVSTASNYILQYNMLSELDKYGYNSLDRMRCEIHSDFNSRARSRPK